MASPVSLILNNFHQTYQFTSSLLQSRNPISHQAKTNSATAFASASTSTTSPDGTVKGSLSRKQLPSRSRRPTTVSALFGIQNLPDVQNDALSRSDEILKAHELKWYTVLSQIAAASVIVVVGRSGLTLLNVLADVVRFLRGSCVAESHRSLVESSDSPSSQAWISSCNLDEVQVSNVRSVSSSISQEPSSTDQTLLTRGSTQNPIAENSPSSSGWMEREVRKIDEIFMREALEEAKKAADMWEVPVGAVLVHDGKIIARGYNLVEDLRDSTAHAEMICIREASNILKAWRLSDTTLYVTLEPCVMCAGAILQARIGTLVYGAPNKLLGADGSWIRLFPSGAGGEGTAKPECAPVHPFHPDMTIRRGILEAECADAMKQFFRLRRKLGSEVGRNAK